MQDLYDVIILVLMLIVLISLVIINLKSTNTHEHMGIKTGSAEWIDLPYTGCDQIDQARYNQLTKNVIKHYTQKTKKVKKPKALVMIGNPGVGKSTVREKAVGDLFDKDNGYVLCDPDDIIENHVSEYKDGLNLKTLKGKQTGYGTVNAWMNCIGLGLDLSYELLLHAIDNQKNILLDFPLSYEYIPKLKRNGYYVKLVYVKAKGYTKRRLERAFKTGRFLDHPDQMKKEKDEYTVIDEWSDFVGKWADDYQIFNI